MMMRPSYANGYYSPARAMWRAKYPNLWRGCVGYWSPILGPTGGTLFDVSGNGNHGVLTNMTAATAWAVGRHGHELRFSGASQYVSFPSISGIINKAKIAFSMWFRREADNNIIAMMIGSAAGARIEVDVWSDGLVYLTIENGGYSYPYFASNDDNWHNLAFNFDGTQSGLSRMAAYLDGVPITLNPLGGDPPTSTPNISSAFELGRNTQGGGTYSTGRIAELAWWGDRNLSPVEISLLAQHPGIMLEIDEDDLFAALSSGGGVNRRRRLLMACG